jgi:peroxiredoxin Q/BCP
MANVALNERAPDFTLPTLDGTTLSLSEFRGQKVVLYFYPKDDTPGCTQEACDFRDNLIKLKELGTAVLGISKDSPESHQRFTQKYKLPFPLLSDEEGKVCGLYGVLKEKTLFGKKTKGIERSTFLIDEKGIVREIWRKVKAKGHVLQILDRLKTL